MNLDLLLKLVREPGSLEAANQADLEALVAEYPYFTAAQLLLLKLYKQQNSIHFNKQLRKVAALAPSREHVYDLVEVLPTFDESPEPVTEAAPPALEVSLPIGEPEVVPMVELVAAAASEITEKMEVSDELIETEAALEEIPLDEALPEVDTQAFNEPTAEPTAIAEEVGAEVYEEAVAEEALVPAEPAFDPALESPVALESIAEEKEAMLLTETAAAAALGTEEETVVEESQAAMAREPSLVPERRQEKGVQMASEGTIAGGYSQDADFIQTAHDRLSWFRYFAGKPLREQPDEVLEQLYLEHMQQDLLKAPETTPESNIKAKVNFAEEVESSVSMEEEIKRLAYDSISDDELPASETLARIYEKQHEYKRAIKIYQKLILKFPDKMTYFAGLIEELRKKA
ncbi:MAG: hypothetical protein C0424_02455 [Sphingobacteriaceae bacterium]|nr:hypothetical protein [Sphingobacteriaceae bacterium]